MKLKVRVLFFVMLLWGIVNSQGLAQSNNVVIDIEKVSADSIGWFDNKYDEVLWTGIGLGENLEIDRRQTNELRARLQTAFGNPTKTIEDLIGLEDFLASQAIQFEYWFVVNDTIPLVALDVDGPFRRGLVLGSDIKYEYIMPKVKQAFSNKLMDYKIGELSAYNDFYFSTERNQWYQVTFNSGNYRTKEIPRPSSMGTK